MHSFLKLGGSLITDKSQPETPRMEVIAEVARVIAQARRDAPDLQLLIGHGSGSFGHVAAKKYGTHQGVNSREGWQGFAEVAAIADRLNQLVITAMRAENIPAMRFQPSASAICKNQVIDRMSAEPIEKALAAGLVPVVYGDVAIDEDQGGRIISTEMIFSYLAQQLSPGRILLAGDFEGVLDQRGEVVKLITPETIETLKSALGGSSATDVTGGMAAKVEEMLALCQTIPNLQVHIFDGSNAQNIYRSLTQANPDFGTTITAQVIYGN